MVVYCLLIPICGLFLLRTSAIQVNLIALGLASVVYSLLTFIYQQIRCTVSRPVMQGIGTARSHKDFQPPLGIFLPSKEKEIILLEKQIIILGKIPVSNVQFVPRCGTKNTSTGTKNTKPW